MNDNKQCTKCKETKPRSEFSANPQATDGLQSQCKECKAEAQRDRRKDEPKEVHNAKMQAYKAGMRKDKCACCGSPIEGHGICPRCMDAIKVLGGSPATLKQAAKALKWVQEQ
ncbi:hypothetical protein OG548_08310 [Streptomyces sp. NBC_01356]|uniref:hypothetical protein n=1 Tax=Streptomyces sp. NBC_01356 TaxID=2903836 RepID=UPI002E34D53A|nr:hypothetical protein [Streptomyces sp. NBC_01356]